MPVAFDPPEAFLGQPQTRARPTLALIASLPALHPAADAVHHREGRLDRVRRRQRTTQQIVESEPVHRQRFLSPLFERTRRRRIQLQQLAMQLLQGRLGVDRVPAAVVIFHLVIFHHAGAALAHSKQPPDGQTVEIAGVEAPQQCKDFVKSMKPGGLGGHGGSSCSTTR